MAVHLPYFSATFFLVCIILGFLLSHIFSGFAHELGYVIASIGIIGGIATLVYVNMKKDRIAN